MGQVPSKQQQIKEIVERAEVSESGEVRLAPDALEGMSLPPVIVSALTAEDLEGFSPKPPRERRVCPECERIVQSDDLRCSYCSRFLRKPTEDELRELFKGSGLGDPAQRPEVAKATPSAERDDFLTRLARSRLLLWLTILLALLVFLAYSPVSLGGIGDEVRSLVDWLTGFAEGLVSRPDAGL